MIGTVSFVIFITSFAYANIGKMSSDASEYTWDLPILMFMFTAIPAVGGYLARMRQEQIDKD